MTLIISPLNVSLFVVVVLLVSCRSIASSSPPVVALGVDFGTEQMRAVVYAAHSPLQFAIVEDDAGAATVPTAVTWAPKTARRLLGEDAALRAARAPADVLRDPKRLLGLTIDSPALKSFAALFPALSLGAARGAGRQDAPVVVKLDAGVREVFPDEAIASLASYLASATDANVLLRPVGGLHGAKPRAVLVAPTYFSASRRAALKQAFQLGGIDVLDVVDELGAAAVDFGAMHLPSVGPARTVIVVVGAGTVGVGAALAEVSVSEPTAPSACACSPPSTTAPWAAPTSTRCWSTWCSRATMPPTPFSPIRPRSMRLREAVRATKEVCLKTSPSCVGAREAAR
jgi:hypothetical protein